MMMIFMRETVNDILMKLEKHLGRINNNGGGLYEDFYCCFNI